MRLDLVTLEASIAELHGVVNDQQPKDDFLLLYIRSNFRHVHDTRSLRYLTDTCHRLLISRFLY
jgi:hypothetical protein